MKTSSKTKILTTSSLLIAMATVLSFIKVWNMPWGGSVTLMSMVPITVISFKYGVRRGLFCGFVYSLIQLAIGIAVDGLLGWGLTAGLLASCVFLDYIFAFTILGIAGIFAKKGLWGIISGSALAVFLRFCSHVLSGVYVFASAGKLWDGFETSNTWLYSIVYNGVYMLPELILTVLGIYILFKAPKTAEFLLKE